MPTYEFRCPTGHEFDRFFKTISTAPTEVPCPECGAVAQRQLSGGAGLLFKGSGFYLTDYGRNAHRKPAPETKGDGARPEGGKAEAGKPEPAGSEAGTSTAESKTDRHESKTERQTKKGESPKPEAPKPSKPKAE